VHLVFTHLLGGIRTVQDGAPKLGRGRGSRAKASGLIWSPDDGKRPLPHPGKGRLQLFAGITAIGEDVAQPGEEIADRSQHADRAVPILSQTVARSPEPLTLTFCFRMGKAGTRC
jgi:hypothetical protein